VVKKIVLIDVFKNSLQGLERYYEGFNISLIQSCKNRVYFLKFEFFLYLIKG
jgi:hypothetical protein